MFAFQITNSTFSTLINLTFSKFEETINLKAFSTFRTLLKNFCCMENFQFGSSTFFSQLSSVCFCIQRRIAYIAIYIIIVCNVKILVNIRVRIRLFQVPVQFCIYLELELPIVKFFKLTTSFVKSTEIRCIIECKNQRRAKASTRNIFHHICVCMCDCMQN